MEILPPSLKGRTVVWMVPDLLNRDTMMITQAKDLFPLSNDVDHSTSPPSAVARPPDIFPVNWFVRNRRAIKV